MQRDVFGEDSSLFQRHGIFKTLLTHFLLRVIVIGNETNFYILTSKFEWTLDIRIKKIISAPISTTNFFGGFSTTRRKILCNSKEI